MKLFKLFFYYTITTKDCSNSFLKTLENHVSPKVLDSNTVLGVGDLFVCRIFQISQLVYVLTLSYMTKD